MERLYDQFTTLESRLRETELQAAIIRARVEDNRDLLVRHLNEAPPILDRIRELEKLIGLMDQDLQRLQDSVGATSGIRAHIDAMADRIKHLEERESTDNGKWQGAKATVHVGWVVITFIVSAVMWYVGWKVGK